MSLRSASVLRTMTRVIAGRGLGRIPGARRFYKLIYQALSPTGIVAMPFDGIQIFVDTMDKFIAPTLVTGIGYELYEKELFKGLLRPGMIVADIGANNGYYALLAARLVGPHGRVYAFEAECRNFGLLLKSVEANGYTNLITVHRAVSNWSGQTTRLFLDGLNSGGPSLSPTNIPECPGSEEIETTGLDEFFGATVPDREVDLLKMDIQGAEGLAIEGADRLLHNPNLIIMMEFWPFGLRNLGTDPEQLLNHLRSYGFEIKLIDEATKSVRSVGISEAMARCENRCEGRGFVDLLLQKPADDDRSQQGAPC